MRLIPVASATSASDNFNRADGPLGANWTDISDGGMAISSGAVIGTAGRVTGDMWTAGTFTSDQFSEIQVTSTQLGGGVDRPAVRVQSGGQDGYVGLYYWNSGSPELMLFKRSGGGWGQLGSTYNPGRWRPGPQLEVTAVGSTISLLENGMQVISVSDSSLPGARRASWPTADTLAASWSGGDVVSHTVGGTVSGLSGTVCLQDNGGDTLSVGGNGSFTFATPVINGAALQGDGEDQPVRADLHGDRRLGHGGVGRRDRCRGFVYG